MKFGPVDIDDAVGGILAHSATTPEGRIKKGRKLAPEDIARLKRAGITSLIVAQLDPGDIDEDTAAARIAKAIVGPNVRVAEAFTGRANVFAMSDGLLQADRDRLIALNRIDEGLTVATLAPFQRVSAGQMVATIKIIPFALRSDIVAAAEAQPPPDEALIAVAAFRPHRVGLVVTDLPGAKASLLIKRIKAMTDRVEAACSSIVAQRTVAHDRKAVREAVVAMHEEGADPILVFGASAIVDREDVIPGGIADAGGRNRSSRHAGRSRQPVAAGQTWRS